MPNVMVCAKGYEEPILYSVSQCKGGHEMNGGLERDGLAIQEQSMVLCIQESSVPLAACEPAYMSSHVPACP